ncbi:ATP-binding protein [Caenimonas sedimenti]|uniref:ATP-binding protein n=1 Tax=Caenimonas sedimenti TaxID=2596921 RepID=UPI001C97FCFF|nr:ATP-binding protein [Caenimonas sedimenti]
MTAQSVRLNLESGGAPSGVHFDGARYGIGEVGEFVLIEGQTALLLGRMIEVRVPEQDRRKLDPSRNSSSLDAVGTIQLLGSVSMASLRVSAGVDGYPRLGDRVYAAPHQFIADLPRLMEPEERPGQVLINLGAVDGAADAEISVKPEKLFGRHCAILGATGGGKSWTTARIVEECIRYRSKLVLLDATGEYRGFNGQFVTNVHLGVPVEVAQGSISAELPATSFSESDFIALFEPAGKVQGPKLRSAIRSLRLAALKPEIAVSGLIVKADQPRAPFVEALRDSRIQAAIDDPTQPFDVLKLARQIELECVYPHATRWVNKEKVQDTSHWGPESGDFSFCLTLVGRINAIVSSPAFAPVFRPKGKSLTELTSEFMLSDARLFRVCLSGISYEYNAREIFANVIGRHLLLAARKGAFKAVPLVVIVDEAHNFLGRHIGGEDTVARLDAFELVAKEGRKYGLTVCLTTQRPRDVTEGVLSQMGTLIVHRLTNDRDREVVERACGEIDRSASAFLPNLKPGEAAIIGADFPIPLTIRISPPGVEPKSEGPSYQQHWRLPG